jgi:translation initiation factor IF-2
MSKVRVYELATQLGVEVETITNRCEQLGLRIEGHLDQLDEAMVVRLKKELVSRPAGEVTQKRVRSGVIRRRRRGEPKAPEEAPVQQAVAPPVAAEAPIPEPTPVVEEVPAAVSAEEPPPVETAVEKPVEVVEVSTEPEPAPAAPVAAESVVEETGSSVAAEVKTDAVALKPVSSSPYANHQAVNDPTQAQPAVRRGLAQVVREVAPELKASLLQEAQRRAERLAGGPRPPRGRTQSAPVAGAPGAAAGAGAGAPGAAPGPGLPGRPENRKKGKRRGGGRVAYDRAKDRFLDQGPRRRNKRTKKRSTGLQMEKTVPKASKRVIKMDETITVAQLANDIAVKASEVIRVLMDMGEMVTVNHVLDMDTVSLIAADFGFTVENVAFDIENFIPSDTAEGENKVLRDPIVTVMGHVDHGKTSLLDYIRKARVAAGESGGITQHIGAYKVPVLGANAERSVVFLDTPGHAAFTEMRARGAQVTDVVVLVVAADDGVMPQTVEAVNHAKAAGVPVVVAVNKCDKEDANPERVRQELADRGVLAEEWGGNTQFINVSAHTGEGVPELLEAISLQSEMLELTATADRPAVGVVIEAELSRGRGPVATIIIQEGTLNKGDIVVAGKAMGRVRAMTDSSGVTVTSAGPATPVEVLGLNEVPPPSERFFVVKDERDGRQIVSHLDTKDRNRRLAEERKRVTLDDLFDQMKTGAVKQLGLVIKSDVQGSLEALRHSFGRLKHPELEVRIIHSGVGAISESDVSLASASNAIIIGFNVRPEKNAKALAEQEGVDLKLYSVIYHAIDDVKAALEGLLDPLVEEKSLGKASIKETFTIPKKGTIAGCAVLQGKLARGAKARLVRDGVVVYTGSISGLRRFKDDVHEVERGHECGAQLSKYNDVKIGDEIECFEMIEIAQKLQLESE